jgi:hypothetical protein
MENARMAEALVVVSWIAVIAGLLCALVIVADIAAGDRNRRLRRPRTRSGPELASPPDPRYNVRGAKQVPSSR